VVTVAAVATAATAAAARMGRRAPMEAAKGGKSRVGRGNTGRRDMVAPKKKEATSRMGVGRCCWGPAIDEKNPFSFFPGCLPAPRRRPYMGTAQRKS